MAKTNIEGHTGILRMGEVPITCLTSSSYNRTANTVEKVTMCTQGQTITTVQSISKDVQIEGEFMSSSSFEMLRTQMKSKAPATFTLLGRGGNITFSAIITSLSDNFTAGEDA